MDQNSIVALPSKVLRQRSSRITIINEATRQLAQQMIAALLDWEKHRKNEVGVALAAPQVGKAERIIVVPDKMDDPDKRTFHVFINPEIVKTEGQPTEESEGCLSVADIYAQVPRYPKVKVKALNLEGKAVRLSASGFLARVLQHEIDHLHGVMFIDRVKDSDFCKLADDGELIPLSKKDLEAVQKLRVEPNG